VSGLPAPFEWRGGQIAIGLPAARALFTTCSAGDLSAGGSDALECELGIPLAQSPQVHGAGVRVVRSPQELETPAPEADAQVTTLRGVACTVRVADCLPIVLAAPEAVAAVHGGWRGLAAGVLEAALAELRELGDGTVTAAIGHGARVCCYEAGDEVHAAFARHGPAARVERNADLVQVAIATLREQGVETVHDCGICTICAGDGLLWSHRREGERAGRQGGVAWRS
jgi:YfiH family protein